MFVTLIYDVVTYKRIESQEEVPEKVLRAF